MRVMVIVKATEDSEKGVPPTPEAFAAMDRFTEELVKAGIMVAGAGLKPSSQAKRIVCEGAARKGPRRTVRREPRAASRELIAGFSIWEVKDMDEGVAWARRCPNPGPGVSAGETHQAIEATFRIERARLVAGLARLVRSVDRAEELAQDALVVALYEWPIRLRCLHERNQSRRQAGDVHRVLAAADDRRVQWPRPAGGQAQG